MVSLHAKVVTVTFAIKNTGALSGHEVSTILEDYYIFCRMYNIMLQVPQLYLSPPASANSPPKLLKGFDSVFVPAGGSVTVSMQLSPYDFSVWNTVQQRWSIPAGTTGVSIGASSRDIRLTGSISA